METAKAGRPREFAATLAVTPVTPALRQAVDEYAEREGVSRAEAVRRLLAAGVERDKSDGGGKP